MRDLLAPLVPRSIEFRHRSWPRRTSARTRSRSSSGTASRTCRSTRRARGRRTSSPPVPRRRTRRIRPLPRPQRKDVEHPRREVVAPLRLDVRGGRACRVGRRPRSAGRRGRRGLCAVQQQPRRLRAADAAILRGLLDEAGVPASGGLSRLRSLRRSSEAPRVRARGTGRRRASITSRTSGRPRTNTRSDCCSCSMHRDPIVSVSQPCALHCMTIGMDLRIPASRGVLTDQDLS